MKRGSVQNRSIDFYIGIPVLNLLAVFHHKRTPPLPPRRIGLLFNPSLGDTLLASASAQDVRALYPEAKLILFATQANAAAARLLPGIDEVVFLQITRPWKAVAILRRNNLDWMLDFTAWQRITAICTLLSGAKYTVGFARKGQHRDRGYDTTVQHRGDCHELENLRRFTRLLGASSHAAPRLALPRLALPSVSESANLVVFHPWASGARSWLREWPEDRWVALACGLLDSDAHSWPKPGQPIQFLITGSPADEPRCHSLETRLNSHRVLAQVLIGRNGIAEVARLLERASLLISVNTGIMHLGAIVGAPTISINGPTSARRWGPVGPRTANVGPADGSGGYLDLGFEYRGKPTDVMKKVSVADVMAAAKQLLPASQWAGAQDSR